MEKNIKDYLHLYLGCELWHLNSKMVLNGRNLDNAIKHGWKPILRPLRDITDEEIKECAEIGDCLPYGWSKHVTNYKILKTEYPNEGTEIKVAHYSFRITNKGAFYLYDYNRSLCMYAPKSTDVIRFLLSRYFDLFGLIEAGLAIDKTTLK